MKKKRRAGTAPKGKYPVIIPGDITQNMKTLGKNSGLALFILFLSGLNIVLQRLSGIEDIIIGTPSLRKKGGDDKGELLRYSSRAPGHLTFKEFILQTKETAAEMFKKKGKPGDERDKRLREKPGREPADTFDIVFIYDKIQKESQVLEQCPLVLVLHEGEEDMELIVEYDVIFYTPGVIGQLASQVVDMFDDLPGKLDREISKIGIEPGKEKERLLLELNETRACYPLEKTLHKWYREQEERTPGNTAVTAGEKKLTYRELNRLADRLAGRLRRKGAGQETIVGLMLEPGLEMIAAVLGILKSGGAYLPIDPRNPRERVDYMLKDSGVGILLAAENLESLLSSTTVPNVSDPSGENEIIPSAGQRQSAASLAYIIYTSGTTGKPKGVMIEHKNVVRLMRSGNQLFNFNARETWTVFHSYCFDFSVWEMYGALLFGAKLVMVPRIAAIDTRLFLELIKKEAVTILNQTPTAFYNLLNEELGHNRKQLNLKYIIFGGEALTPVKLREWKCKYPGTGLINMYGITETTVHVTYKQIGEKEIESNISNIGLPIPGMRTHVMDNNLKMVPPGVRGELCVGGTGVGRGYINSPGLTKEKFVENPYKPGEILYRSKDLVRKMQNGEMEYLGRIDHQVKIRGYRVELGEIESHLLKHPGIREAVVEAREKPGKEIAGDKYLCAYIVPAPDPAGRSCREPELREYLSGVLPAYMQPAYYVILKKFPLSPNGKIHRKALPDPFAVGMTGTDKIYIPPRDKMEWKLVKIWQEVLNLERISIGDDFFGIGGHSLKATQVLSRIYKEMKAKIELKTIFQYPTIEGLAQVVREAITVEYQEIPAVEKREYYELSHAQKRLWILDKFEENQTAYNLPVAVLFKGSLDREAMESTLDTILKRHESLGTIFITLSGQPWQKIPGMNAAGGSPVVEFIDLRKKTGKEAIAREIAAKETAAPFNLARGPLARIKLLQLEDEKHLFLLALHHIVSDGWSMNVLTNEIITLYSAYRSGKENPLIPLRLQYKDYAAAQNKKLSGWQLEQHRNYWKHRLQGEIPVLHLYTDKPRPPLKTFKGNSHGMILERRLTEGLNKISREMGATLFMTLLAAVNTLLYRYTGQEDIIIGTPIAGRDHRDLENQVGFYLNTLPLRTRFRGHQGYDKLLEQVKETALGAFGHQDYPFDRLVEELELKRELNRSPLFDVFLVLQNTRTNAAAGKDTGMQGLTIENYDAEINVSKFDITFYFMELEDGLYFLTSYNTDLFTTTHIQRQAQHFKGIVTAIVETPGQGLDRLDYIPAEEKRCLISGLNAVKPGNPRNKATRESFEEQVEKTPPASAVVFADLTLSYLELNKQANRLGRYLKKEFLIQDEDRIGIFMTKTEKAIIGILAILKTGAAFLALDPADTSYRVNYMVEDSRCKILLTQHQEPPGMQLQQPAWNQPAVIVDPEGEKQRYANYSSENINPRNKPHHTAYVVYTSGTTGKPKGVVVEHRQLDNFIRGVKGEYRFKEGWRYILATSLTFDASYRQIFIPLTIGAQLHIVIDIQDVKLLVNYLEKRKINVLYSVPVIWKEILQEIREKGKTGNLSWIASSGDVLTPGLARELMRTFNEAVLVNMYGPTETTMVAMGYEVKPNNRETPLAPLFSLPLGKPFPNYEVMILDASMRLVPGGVVGEICISGEGVTRGYQNNPALTREKFVKNPFGKGHKKMYRTGDMGVYLSNGEICIQGRKDSQVKIRGIRIEIQEIEKILLKLEYIERAVVIAHQDKDGKKRLTAFFTARQPDREIPVTRIREEISRYLPRYMIPTSFIRKQAFPLTASGKIDRKALADIRLRGKETLRAGMGEEYEPPRNDLEKRLAATWEKVLKRKGIGVNDNFFEIGGDSITAVRLTYEIGKNFNTAIALKELFRYPTIAEFAGYMLNEQRNVDRMKKVSFYKINSKYRQNQECTIIGFPPMRGFSFAFHKLGEVLEYPMVLFNMIIESIDGDPIDDNKGLIKEFVKQIAMIEIKGPLMLMGWSAGGKLAFEVCQALEIAGIKVNKVIMIDSSKIILKEGQDFVEKRLAFHRRRLKREKNTAVQIDDAMKRMRRYFDFYLSVEHTGTINADIVMIASKITVMSPDKKPNTPNLVTAETKDMIGTKYWKDMTTGRFVLYTGYGLHGDMLSPEYVAENAQIIKSIFEEKGDINQEHHENLFEKRFPDFQKLCLGKI
jgi:amino acid adenylation domain-containing protein